MLGSRFSEMHSGMRAYNRKCLLTLPFLNYTDDFSFDTQMLVDAVTLGLRVVEVPIPTRYTKESSSIAVGPSLRYISESLAYCARRSAERGRRGRRTAVANGRRRARRLPGLGRAGYAEPCNLCGNTSYTFVARATGGAAREGDFSCAGAALGLHDDLVQCRTCGLVRALTPLAPDELAARYAGAVDERYLAHEDHRRALFDHVLHMINGYLTPGSSLLEIGSATGLFLSMARERGWNPSGIEPSAWAANIARERFNADVLQTTLEAFDPAQHGEPAEVIVMLDVLEHLIDPLGSLRKIRAMINPEGALVLSTANLGSIHARLRGSHWPWFLRSHLHTFTQETLARALDESGFRLVGVTTMPRSFPLSYAATRGAESHRLLSKAANAVTAIADPTLPFGLLGDSLAAVARPV
jgi:2-polyprenyl-3-methyl-5-hydroxy-6-metoxy-1,4-benzoquinol methylase